MVPTSSFIENVFGYLIWFHLNLSTNVDGIIFETVNGIVVVELVVVEALADEELELMLVRSSYCFAIFRTADSHILSCFPNSSLNNTNELRVPIFN